MKTGTKTDTARPKFLAASFPVAKGGKLSIHQQMSGQTVVFIYNGTSFKHKKKFWYMLQYECTLKTSQTQKDKYLISYFYEVSRKGKFEETESTLEFTENWMERRMEVNVWWAQNFWCMKKLNAKLP